jgi:hypothetical protein
VIRLDHNPAVPGSDHGTTADEGGRQHGTAGPGGERALLVIRVAAWRLVPSCPPASAGSVDWLGTFTLAGGLFAVLFGFSQAPGWGSAGFITLEAVGLLLLGTFVVIERRVGEPWSTCGWAVAPPPSP